MVLAVNDMAGPCAEAAKMPCHERDRPSSADVLVDHLRIANSDYMDASVEQHQAAKSERSDIRHQTCKHLVGSNFCRELCKRKV